MAGADRVETERFRPVQNGRELDLLVAAEAGIRGIAAGVLVDEILNDVGVEALGHVPDVERDADHVGGAACVPCVLQGAAAARPGPVGLRVGGQGKVHAGHVMARFRRPAGGHRGVDAAGHRGEHAQSSHHLRGYSPHTGGLRRPAGQSRPEVSIYREARRARSTTSPMTAPSASTSACELDRPRENRSDPRARASPGPLASSTWLGWAMPAVHADPVEQAMPLASSSISSASPSQPGKEKCALPGSLAGPGGAPFRIASGTAARTCAIRSSLSAASRLASSPRREVASWTAQAKALIAGASRVPERTSRSWPPPGSTGTRSVPLVTSRAPGPTGPPLLLPGVVGAAGPPP